MGLLLEDIAVRCDSQNYILEECIYEIKKISCSCEAFVLPTYDEYDYSSVSSLTIKTLEHIYALEIQKIVTILEGDCCNINSVLNDVYSSDLACVRKRDPACTNYLIPILFFKGFHAICLYRLSNFAWKYGYKNIALFLQNKCTTLLSVDIHPAATIGSGLFLDHATGIVIGETTVIGDDVSILQNVTLGGTGKDSGDRHPKVGNGVLLGAGSKVLGNIKVGDYSKIAAGSIVLSDIPRCSTAVGVPAKVVKQHTQDVPSDTMNQYI
ncbi:serine O-acetyltransferase [Pseudomonadota bacterium]